MPIYEYQCQKCGAYHEVICTMSARKDEIECPRCKGIAEQVISACAVLTSNMSNMTQDVAIGRDADKRWAGIHERRAYRDKVRAKLGSKNLTVSPNGTRFTANDKQLQFVSTPEPKEG